MMRAVPLAQLVVALLCWPTFAAAQDSALPLSAFRIVYEARAHGVQAGEVTYSFTFSGSNYEGASTRRLTGLARLLLGSAQDFSYSARGRIDSEGRMHPIVYQHRDGGRKHRLVRVNFSDREATTTAEPPMGMGDPPATPEQRRGVIDQISLLAQMLVVRGDPCRQTYHVFMDGRSRFDLALSPGGSQTVSIGGYRGSANRCVVQFLPIAGFPDPEAPQRLAFLFAPFSGYFVPLSIEMPTDSIGIVRLEASHFEVTQG